MTRSSWNIPRWKWVLATFGTIAWVYGLTSQWPDPHLILKYFGITALMVSVAALGLKSNKPDVHRRGT